MDKIIEVLRKNPGVNAWKISYKNTKSCELFFVGTKLETNRVENVSDTEVTIYVDKDHKRGSSSFSIYPYMDEKMLNDKVNDNIKSATFALNEFYEIPSKSNEHISEVKSNLKDSNFKDVAKEIAYAVFSSERVKEATLNATEIFVYEIKDRIINSNGVDVNSTSYKINIELIPTWTTEKESVEVYEMLKYGELDTDKIKEDVEKALMDAKARSEATKLKINQEVNVIIGGEEVERIMSFFVNDLSYTSKYQHMNRFNVGDNVQGEDVKGDLISIKLVPSYVGAMKSSAIDKDGVILKEVNLIDSGVALTNHGEYRFGYYLKESKPTGILPVMVCKEGNTSFNEMKQKPYIRCVKFSGMQLEGGSGFFGGEVRLGFYFDGTKEIPVTGFSVSGNIHEAKKNMTLSKEIVTLGNYHGPKYILFKGMKVA